jgi:hypothetical protein
MRKNSIKNKHNNTIQKLKSNTRNKMNSDKKKFAISKKKYFSISSKEDIVKNTFRNCLVNKELEYYSKTHRNSVHQKMASPNSKFCSHNISHNSKKKMLTEKIKSAKNKSKIKISSMFHKNGFKKTIIIDNEGNTNLNIKNIFGNENKCPKMCLVKLKKNTNKLVDRPIVELKKPRKCISSKNDVLRKLIICFKQNELENNTNTLTETNSLFVNSNNMNGKKVIISGNFSNIEDNNEYNKILDKGEEEKGIKEYNRIKDIFNLNLNEIKQINSERKRTMDFNYDVCNYSTFVNNIQENKEKENKDCIINNKEINNNANNISEPLSFLESSISDEFYQALLIKKVPKDIVQNDDSFNLNQSTNEFENIKKEKEKDFENNIHLLKKKDIKIITINALNKKSIKDQIKVINKEDKLVEYKYDKNINENKNSLCIIF